MNLNSAKIFVHVVSRGSFSAASKFLNIPVSTVSRRVSELEEELNLRLLERTTRQLRLTESGATLYEFVARGLEEMDAGLLELEKRETELKGLLRLSIPPSFVPWFRIIDKFQEAYPNITIDLHVTAKKLDLIEDGIDVALRVGNVENFSAVSRKITGYRHRVVATPEFLKKHPTPQVPNDLLSLPCAAWAKKSTAILWDLGGQKIKITPKIRADDYTVMLDQVFTGRYFTELPPFFCDNEIKNGELVELLPDYPSQHYDLQLVYPNRKQLSRIARVYIDFCLEHYPKYNRG